MHLLHPTELDAVQEYFLETASVMGRTQTFTYIIAENAAQLMPKQADSCTCGVYCARIADSASHPMLI